MTSYSNKEVHTLLVHLSYSRPCIVALSSIMHDQRGTSQSQDSEVDPFDRDLEDHVSHVFRVLNLAVPEITVLVATMEQPSVCLLI